MKKNYFSILVFLLLYAKVVHAQTTVVLPCSQSVELFSLTPDTPVDTGSHGNDLNANAWTYSGTSGYERSLLDFDLTQIPAGATIVSAYVRLYNNFYCTDDAYQNGQHSHVTNSNASWLQRVTNAWSDSSATWNNQPATDTTGQVILPQDTNPNENYTLDVTALIQNMHADQPSHGFMLRLQNEQTYACLLFASSRHPDTTLRPTLEVTYTECISLTLPCSQSVELFSLTPDTPVDTGSHGNDLNANAWTYTGTTGYERSLLDFDLTQIPLGATVVSAYLNLYNNFYCTDDAYQNGQHSHVTNSNASWLQRITNSWSQDSATWNNQPVTDTTGEVILPQDTNPNENYTLDVTTLIQNMHDNQPSHGFMLRLQNEQTYACLLFASSRNPDLTIRPKLDICYMNNNPTGINEKNHFNAFTIFPNPSKGSFTISFPNISQKGSIEIFNSIGQEIYSENISGSIINKEVNLNAAAGIYFVKLNSGENQYMQKLVLQ